MASTKSKKLKKPIGKKSAAKKSTAKTSRTKLSVATAPAKKRAQKFRWQGKSLQQAIDIVGKRTAEKHPHGFRFSDSSGCSLFIWFKGESEMLAYLSDVMSAVFVDPDGDKEELTLLKKKIEAIIKRHKDKASPKLKTAANRVLKKATGASIVWMGTFDELCQGTTKFAREMRAGFRCDENVTTKNALIKKSERRAFAKCLHAMCG